MLTPEEKQIEIVKKYFPCYDDDDNKWILDMVKELIASQPVNDDVVEVMAKWYFMDEFGYCLAELDWRWKELPSESCQVYRTKIASLYQSIAPMIRAEVIEKIKMKHFPFIDRITQRRSFGLYEKDWQSLKGEVSPPEGGVV